MVICLCLIGTRSIAFANDSMQESSQQRLAAVTARIAQTVQQEQATLVRGTVRLHVFGPEATVAFYALSGTEGIRQHYMLVLETQTATAAGDAVAPIKTANLTARRDPTRQVVVGHARIDRRDGRLLDVARATVKEDHPEAAGFHLLATVTVPVLESARSATFRISHPFGIETATISAEND